MPERIVPLTPDNYFHIFNRGVNKGLVFFSERNYRFFIDRMQAYLQPNSEILAFCLMPNHFHLLVKVVHNQFAKESLHPFLLSYAKAINREQDRVGPLFQGRFQAFLIEDENYLLDCVKYIHLNPVNAYLSKTPSQWKYSSYSTYLGNSYYTFVDTSIVLSYFSSLSDFREFHEFEMEEYQSKYFAD